MLTSAFYVVDFLAARGAARLVIARSAAAAIQAALAPASSSRIRSTGEPRRHPSVGRGSSTTTISRAAFRAPTVCPITSKLAGADGSRGQGERRGQAAGRPHRGLRHRRGRRRRRRRPAKSRLRSSPRQAAAIRRPAPSTPSPRMGRSRPAISPRMGCSRPSISRPSPRRACPPRTPDSAAPFLGHWRRARSRFTAFASKGTLAASIRAESTSSPDVSAP